MGEAAMVARPLDFRAGDHGVSDELTVGGTEMGGRWHSSTPALSLPTQEDVSTVTASIRSSSNPEGVRGWMGIKEMDLSRRLED